MLFAAGRGERLRPLSDAVPKPALPLLDVPLASPLLARLRALGDVVVNVSHLGDEVIARLGLEPAEVLREIPEPYGTAGTLAALAPDLADPVLVANADLLTDLEPRDLLAAHRAAGAALTLAAAPVTSGADLTARAGRATGFIDRRRTPHEPGLRYLGMAVLGRAALGLLPGRRPAGLGEHVVAPLCRRGEAAVVEHRGYALDCGTPAAFLQASLDALSGVLAWQPPGRRSFGAYLGPGAESAGELGPGAIVLSGARVETGARIEQAVVWPGTTVPPGIELRRAVWFSGRAVPA